MNIQCPPWLTDSRAPWTTEELADRLISGRQVARLVQSGDLVRLRRGCYIPGHFWEQQSAETRALHRIYAHHHSRQRGAPTPPVYTHVSAARIHGLHLWNVDHTIHLAQKYPTSAHGPAADVRAHCSPLEPEEITYRQNLRVTTLERTAVDCARVLSYQKALIVADHALRLGGSQPQMQDIAGRLAGCKGAANARRVTADASPLAESPGETLSRHFIRKMRVPMPEQQVQVRTRHGDHRLDFAWRELLLALEFDGRIKYFAYAPTDEVLFEERRREKALMEDGWQFVRLEWADLFREAKLRRRIANALHRASLLRRKSA
ncbi:type IV toxin-antitoxin system AbiEi family antitoxin domain-containing protein [Arthrobacter sp. CAN_C5]|uniref:type IV toxin-antitoxin system AbiEi family antitoxin domain-containing protein n=1 Tax=Arthrobacter sp. CAN_C5 TaxID=2760706 RepID=UPI001AEB4777|nr:type IV toxin-antitoxin system AbiEi family antitoxin domain-containing protein [Arthrobacter sp. CAN_C5]MBP2218277.1 very-short-patch-repair endonuclease [Arthrobacter sp. CAN_C5]